MDPVYGGIAQLVEQSLHTGKVAGSIPAIATMKLLILLDE